MEIGGQTILAFIGIALSILFFMVGYRRTIGAKQERKKIANKEILEGILKRLVLEELSPSIEELERFTAGKARQHLLKPQHVLSIPEVLDGLYAMVLDNDFIDRERRQQILGKLRALAIPPATSPLRPPAFLLRSQTKERTSIVAATLAIAASLMGAVSVFLVDLLQKKTSSTSLSEHNLTLALGTFAAALATIIPIVLFRRLKDKQEEIRSVDNASEPQEFEKSVLSLLQLNDIPFEQAERGAPFDLRITLGDQVYLVELKLSLTRIPVRLLSHIMHRIAAALPQYDAKQGIIVSLAPIPERVASRSTDEVVIICARAFQAMIEEKKRR